MIRYDARGHGASPGLADPAAYEWPALALDLVAVLDATGLGRCAIGGASVGCVTALGAALIVPRRIDRRVLVTPPTAWTSRAAQRVVYEEAARLVDGGGTAALIEFGRGETPPAVLGDAGALARRAGLEQIGAMDTAVLAAVLRGAAVSDRPPPEVLAAITQPALVLGVVDDAGHPVSTAEILADTPPAAELHVAPDLDTIRRWPALVERFAEFVRAWVTGVRRPSPSKFIDSTVILINAPAGSHSHGLVSMIVSDWASLRMPPHVAVGGEMPKSRPHVLG